MGAGRPLGARAVSPAPDPLARALPGARPAGASTRARHVDLLHGLANLVPFASRRAEDGGGAARHHLAPLPEALPDRFGAAALVKRLWLAAARAAPTACSGSPPPRGEDFAETIGAGPRAGGRHAARGAPIASGRSPRLPSPSCVPGWASGPGRSCCACAQKRAAQESDGARAGAGAARARRRAAGDPGAPDGVRGRAARAGRRPGDRGPRAPARLGRTRRTSRVCTGPRPASRCPSLMEGFGLPVLEAMRRELPWPARTGPPCARSRATLRCSSTPRIPPRSLRRSG